MEFGLLSVKYVPDLFMLNNIWLTTTSEKLTKVFKEEIDSVPLIFSLDIGSIVKDIYFITWLLRSGGSVVDCTLDYNPGVTRSIPRFSGLSDETINRGPVSVWTSCWWDTHLLTWLHIIESKHFSS